MTEVVLPVSIGEAIDKYSILIIKQTEIKDPSRLKDINEELQAIYPYISDHLEKYKYHYECLKYVNKKIWDLSDLVRSPTESQENKNKMYAETFSWNDSRFRIKSKLNKLLSSSLNEQKSYPTNGVKVNPLPHIYDYVFYSLHIRYLAIRYDLVNILRPIECEKEVEEMFKDDPHILVSECAIGGLKEIDLSNVKVPEDFMMLERGSIEESINYLVGGRLGDFVHLLYVVMCKYKATGKKGNIYITDDTRYGGDTFSTSAATVLEELGEIVKKQSYIGDFSIFVPETVDIDVNLNEFRRHTISGKLGWLHFLSLIFHTPPILGPWITLKHEPEDYVLIHRSISLNRQRQNPTFIPFLRTIVENNTCKFITCNLAEYEDFPLKELVPLYKVNTLEEFYNEIQKCKFFIGNQSAPLTFAYSIGKPCLCEHTECNFYTDSRRPPHTFYWESSTNKFIDGVDKYISLMNKMEDKSHVAFINHAIESCGVYQYGKRLGFILKKSSKTRFSYHEISSLDQYIELCNDPSIDAIIYNYHVSTMKWLNGGTIQKRVPNIGIHHENTVSGLFNHALHIDARDDIDSIPRPLFEYSSDLQPEQSIPIIGSFGFGFENKGFVRLVEYVNDQLDEAIIRLNITFPHFGDSAGHISGRIEQQCNQLPRKEGIKLIITHDFMDDERLLGWLNENTINVFLYDLMPGRGCASTIDYALSVNSPIGISNSYMFRHIYSDKISVLKTPIKDIISLGLEYLKEIKKKWTHEKLIEKLESFLKQKVFIETTSQIK